MALVPAPSSLKSSHGRNATEHEQIEKTRQNLHRNEEIDVKMNQNEKKTHLFELLHEGHLEDLHAVDRGDGPAVSHSVTLCLASDTSRFSFQNHRFSSLLSSKALKDHENLMKIS